MNRCQGVGTCQRRAKPRSYLYTSEYDERVDSGLVSEGSPVRGEQNQAAALILKAACVIITTGRK